MGSNVVANLVHLSNRLWRRKHFIFFAIVLISLVITISYTGTNLSIFSSLPLFSNKHRRPNLVELNNEPILTANKNVHVIKLESTLEQKSSTNTQESGWHNVKIGALSETHSDAAQRYRAYKRYIPQFRMVHLDLKGAPPKLSFFQELFPLLAEAGANSLLLEFEDMFPFEGALRYAASETAYSKEQIRKINSLAKEHNFEVIPLIQTIGHLEYFLKLQQYRHLREVDEFPQAICPSKQESIDLIFEIVDQVISMFPDSKWLHIGCDEVFHIGICDLCKKKDHEELFLSHVHKVAKYVKEKHNVIPIIWDDMLRQIAVESMRKYEFNKIGVELMVWSYIDDIYRFIPYTQWMVYSEIFPNVWGASAFKGAFGETLTVPNIKMHLDNNIAWIDTLKEQVNNFKQIRGLVITGWQRYDHLATLCELLPSGLPSLIIDLLTVSNGKYETKLLNKFDELMKCEKNYYYRGDKIFTQDPNFFSKSSCNFPGSGVFRVMQEFANVDKKVNDYLYDVAIHKAWLTDYNVRHNITSPYRVQEGLQYYHSVMYSLKALMKMAITALSEVYDTYTVYEWIEQKIYPQIIRMEKFYNNTIALQKARVWPKRPLKPLDDLLRILKTDNEDNNIVRGPV